MSSSIEITYIKNLTTEMDIRQATGGFWEASEYSNQSFAIELPSHGLGLSQLALVQGRIQMGGEIRILIAVCKIASVMEAEDGCRRVEFRLQQFNRNLWFEFIDYQRVAQEKAEKLFKTLKGVG